MPSSPPAPVVAVVGATGHTGRFVIDELLRRGVTPVAVGRDAARLAAFEQRGIAVRVAALDDPEALAAALDGAAVVVSCAGPFLDTADAVVAAALRVGAHYLDVTAEQGSVTATHERFDAAARAAGVAVVPAMGFFGGLADLLATAVVEGGDGVDDLRVGIALDSWWPTEGTRATGRRNTAPRLVVEDGALVPLAGPAPRAVLDLPAPFGRQAVTAVPFSEVPLIARHLAVPRVQTWLTDIALADLRDPATPPPVAADGSGRSAQAFVVEVVGRGPRGTLRATAAGRDIYAVTAPLVVEAVVRLLDGTSSATGAVAPGEAFEAASFLAALAPDPLTTSLPER